MFFWIPPLESTGWLQGWLQKQPQEVSALSENYSLIRIKQPRAEKQLETCSVHSMVTNTVCQPIQQVISDQLNATLHKHENNGSIGGRAGKLNISYTTELKLHRTQWVLRTVQ